ncbi:heptaprenyl diphosphate synthase component 1 [Bacillus carboniphilus]|uniref:Heptaprenyl diphosphate synthase component 1 n=1 Tax=Bacillus carboniphilus TaxID=86663 RepID=A0ABY9JZI0_9BACI|nr:heptaprenyl diphosphate synthase component 1 [Bacillus carboniphilus]WLR43743.1 heptaprenyl diphosphate synthase component 1 [Bacillus carboniphilus]
MQEYTLNKTNIRQSLKDHLSHSYLLKYIQQPEIDEDKLLLLLAFFEGLPDLTVKQKHTYVITTLLVQIALDTHEQVTSDKITSQEQLVQRQLTVLAGDFYSGLYYQLLSQIDDISLVRTLARAIKEINEHKMRIYEGNQGEIISLTIVESSLYKHLFSYYNCSSWVQLAESFLMYKKLNLQLPSLFGLDHSILDHSKFNQSILIKSLSNLDHSQVGFHTHYKNQLVNRIESLINSETSHPKYILNTAVEDE